MQLKILHVVPAFYPSRGYGGAPVVAYQLAKVLIKRGHDATVFTTDADDRTSRLPHGARHVNGIKTFYFRNISNSLAYDHKLLISPEMAQVVRKELRSFDVIHLHDFRTFQNVVVCRYAKKRGIPYVLQAHGSLSRAFGKERLKKSYDWIWGYKMLRDASKVIALNKTEAEQYKKMGVDQRKIEIVPNGIDLSEFDGLPSQGEFRKKYSIDGDERILLYIGRLHKSKGIRLLVEAFADLLRELDNTKLLVVGPDDGYLSELEQLIQTLRVSDKVLFTGFITNKEKIAALTSADVFVTPSFSGFPVTFLEACACRTPIITTSDGDELDWIHGRVGYVVDYHREQLRDAIFKLLNDRQLRKRFGENGRRLVSEEFNWDAIAVRLEEVYLKLIADKPGDFS